MNPLSQGFFLSLGQGASAPRTPPVARRHYFEPAVVQRKAVAPAEGLGSSGAGLGASRPDFIVSHPGAPLEQQADAVADSLAGASRTGRAGLAAGAGAAAGGTGVVDARLRGMLHGLEGGGRALPERERSAFEEYLGLELAGVRVHTGTAEGSLAEELGARAFTVGSHVVFAPGQYAPGTAVGDRLLAHELTHVAQQSGGVPTGAGYPPLVQRDTGIGAWWERNVTKGYEFIKEQAYEGLISGVRDFRRKGIEGLRTAATALPASLQGPANLLLTIVEEVSEVCQAAVYVCIGINVGLGEGLVDMIKGLVQLLYTVVELLVLFVLGFFSGNARAAFDQRAEEIVAAVTGLGPALKTLVTDWVKRFEQASSERQSLMIGELTGQIIALILTFEVAAAKAGQIPKLALPVVVPQGERLAVAVAGVSVGEPAVAGVLVGTGAMMTTGGGSGPPTRQQRLDELSKDPDHGGQVTDASRREAQVALELEDAGRLKKPIRRPQKGDGHSGDFVDGAGQDWDMKRPRSRPQLIQEIQQGAVAKGKPPPQLSPNRPIPGEFNVNTTLAEIQGELRAGEKVIVDTSMLEPGDIAALRQAVTNAGLSPNDVIFYP